MFRRDTGVLGPVVASLRRGRELDAQRLDHLTGGLDQVRESLEQGAGSLAEVKESLRELGPRPGELLAGWREIAANAPAVEDRLRQLTELVDGLRGSLHALLGPTGRRSSRLVSDDELELVMSELGFVGRPGAIAAAVHQAYRALVEVELRCVGNFTGSTSDVVADLASIVLMPPPTGELLLIRTPCGVEAVGAARQLLRIGREPNVTVVDPFAIDATSQDAVADASLTPSTPTVARANLGLGGVPSDRFRVIEGMSDAPDAQRAAGDRKYGLVVIGGNRSRAGVHQDLAWVGAIVEPDALIVVNDVGDPSEPEVRAALDRYLGEPGATLRMMGTAGTSAFLRAN